MIQLDTSGLEYPGRLRDSISGNNAGRHLCVIYPSVATAIALAVAWVAIWLMLIHH